MVVIKPSKEVREVDKEIEEEGQGEDEIEKKETLKPKKELTKWPTMIDLDKRLTKESCIPLQI